MMRITVEEVWHTDARDFNTSNINNLINAILISCSIPIVAREGGLRLQTPGSVVVSDCLLEVCKRKITAVLPDPLH